MSEARRSAANVAADGMRKLNRGRDLSARQWAHILVPVLMVSRPVVGYVNEGTPEQRPVFGKPTFRNVLLEDGEHA